jgi:hypothetical protein
MAQKNINPGNAPIIWSTIDDAFKKINSNFTELYLSLGGPGVDLTNLTSSVMPDTDITRDLGSPTKRWRDLYLSGNSLWLGPAKITANADGHVNLPPGSTVGGSVIGTPDTKSFKTIEVIGQEDLLSSTEEILRFSGTGVTITTDPITNTVNFSSTSLDQIQAGEGVFLTRSGSLLTISNSGVVELLAGPGVAITNAGTSYTISNLGPTNVFNNIAVLGQETVTAITGSNTLNLVADNNINLVTNNSTKTIRFSVDNQIDITGSVFSEDSVLLIDAMTGTIVAEQVKGTFQGVTTENSLTIVGDSSEIQSNLNTVTTELNAVNQQIANLEASIASISAQLSGIDPVELPQVYSQLMQELSTYQSILASVQSTQRSLVNQQQYFQSLIANDRVNITYNVGLGLADFDKAVTARVFKGSFAGDLSGSVFADGSTMLIDGSEGKIIGDIHTSLLRTSEDTLAIGLDAGETLQGSLAVAVGWMAGGQEQGAGAVAIGVSAGYQNQGENSISIGSDSGSSLQGNNAIALGRVAGNTAQGHHSIAIGAGAGSTNQAANSIVLNAQSTGSSSTDYVTLSPTASGFYVAPIRELSSAKALYYNPTTKEVTYYNLPSGGGIPGDFSFIVVGDDSTPREVSSGETIQFIGTDGITTSTDADGNVNISAAAVTSLQSRTTAFASTGSINDGATSNLTITGFKGYILYKIQTSAAAWVRIYTNGSSRTADASRTELEDPSPGAGIIAEVITTGNESVPMTPGVVGFNDEIIPNTAIAVAVTNKSGGPADITVSLTLLKIED